MVKSKKRGPYIQAEVDTGFKTRFKDIWDQEGFKTESHALITIVRDWMIKKRSTQEVIYAKLLEAEKKAHIGSFGSVQLGEDGKIKNIFGLLD